MKLLFIDQNSQYYKKAIDLRISLFFNGMENANELICDSLEDRSEHLIYLKGKEMVGTGRLTIYEKFGFEAFGDYYESEKTGVIHQNMSKEARREIRSANN